MPTGTFTATGSGNSKKSAQHASAAAVLQQPDFHAALNYCEEQYNIYLEELAIAAQQQQEDHDALAMLMSEPAVKTEDAENAEYNTASGVMSGIKRGFPAGQIAPSENLQGFVAAGTGLAHNKGPAAAAAEDEQHVTKKVRVGNAAQADASRKLPQQQVGEAGGCGNAQAGGGSCAEAAGQPACDGSPKGGDLHAAVKILNSMTPPALQNVASMLADKFKKQGKLVMVVTAIALFTN